MKLLTKEIEKTLPKLYETEGIAPDQKMVRVKFFTPWSWWTWYAVEGERQEDGDMLFYGFVCGFEGEWGYFSLRELEVLRGTGGLKVERDLYFTPKPFGKIDLTRRG